MSVSIFIWCDFYRSDVHARVTSNWWRQWGMVAPVLARSPVTKVHFVQYSGTIVQLCSKGTLGPWIAQLVHFAQYSSTTWFPITKWAESSLGFARLSQFGEIASLRSSAEHQHHKVTRCLARYIQRATTTNQATNRAPNEPARPGQKWTKMPILGKKSYFFLEKSKVLLPT